MLAQRPAPHGQGLLEWNRARKTSKNVPTADSVRSQLAEKGENMFSVPDYKIALSPSGKKALGNMVTPLSGLPLEPFSIF